MFMKKNHANSSPKLIIVKCIGITYFEIFLSQVK